ncbi:MAG: phytanoyl-CoA dioxygenase family protein [Phycisphaeraceae bacterium]
MSKQTHAEQFMQDGYLIARQVFSASERARLRELAERIREKACRELLPGMRYWTGNKGGVRTMSRDLQARAAWGINEITRPELFEPELVNVWAHPGVHAMIHALLGPEPRAWGIKMLWTPTLADYNLGWHRDQLKRELYDWVHYKPAVQDHVQFNAALNRDNCFLVVPGSHRRPLTETEWQAMEQDPTADLPGQVTAELEPGDILYMDAHALHRGRSSVHDDRLTLHYSAQAQWVPLKPWATDENFDFLCSDAFIQQLAPDARPFYQRLITAERTEDAMAFVKAAAVAHGWQPSASDS